MSSVSFVVEGVGDCELRTWVREGESTVMAVSAFRASFRIGDGLFKGVILEVCVGVVGGDGEGFLLETTSERRPPDRDEGLDWEGAGFERGAGLGWEGED